MNKLEISQKKAAEAGCGQLIVTDGMSYPPHADTLAFADMAVKAGVDILACPVMISDVHVPWMMGGTEQMADVRNVELEIGPKVCWDSIDAVTAVHPELCIMGGSFPSDLVAYGAERFADDCVRHGIVALDCPGYSYVLNAPFTAVARGHKALEERGIAMIQQISSDMALAGEGTREYKLLLDVMNASRGYVLMMMDAGGKSGATGALDVAGMIPAVARVRKLQKELGREMPIIAVCGIASPQNAREVIQMGCDGAMISSAIIRRQQAGETLEQIGQFLSSMKEGLKK